MDEVNEDFIKAFRRFLLSHEKDLKDRTCYNIMQAVSTFLLKNGSSAAKPILKEMSYPPTEVIPYEIADMQRFFEASNEKEELIFKFFLHSMAREMEVANCEVRDLKFDQSIVHICPKPDRNFRLKGKRSGQAKKGRKVPGSGSFDRFPFCVLPDFASEAERLAMRFNSNCTSEQCPFFLNLNPGSRKAADCGSRADPVCWYLEKRHIQGR